MLSRLAIIFGIPATAIGLFALGVANLPTVDLVAVTKNDRTIILGTGNSCIGAWEGWKDRAAIPADWRELACVTR